MVLANPDGVFGQLVDQQATLTATLPAGEQAATISFQYLDPSSGAWVQFGSSTAGPAYAGTFFPGALNLPSGVIDLRAVAEDPSGNALDESPAVQVVYLQLGDTYVGLQGLADQVAGSITLAAAPAGVGSYNWGSNGTDLFGNINTGMGNFPDTVSFEISLAGADSWTTLATVPPSSTSVNLGNGTVQEFLYSLDTTTLADGTYDIRVVAEDAAGDVFVGNELDGILIDNTPPTVQLAPTGSQLSGITTLSATASDNPGGSGVAAVRFEYSPAGAGTWTTIGVISTSPYSFSFDTNGLPNGLYDLRAVATDRVGNIGVSEVIASVSITNSSTLVNPDEFTVADQVVPATNVTLLGSIQNSPQHETWAIGFTTARPATVDGTTPLIYTAPPGTAQVVLLRYEDSTGWQIVDVLRNADGSAYQLPSKSASVTGQMLPDGEAWVLLYPSLGGPGELFHRTPEGTFQLDPTNTANLAPVLDAISSTEPPDLTLGVSSDGTVYGTLVNTGQTSVATPLLTPNGSLATTSTSLWFGSLVGGTWQAAQAPIPSTYVPAGGKLILTAVSPTGSGSGWAEFTPLTGAGFPMSEPLLLSSFTGTSPGDWTTVAQTGLDAFDLTLDYAPAVAGVQEVVAPTALLAPSSCPGGMSECVWIQAIITANGTTGLGGTIVALFDPTTSRVVAAWCSGVNASTGCISQIDAAHPAAVPQAVFQTPSGSIALAEVGNQIDVYAYGTWTAVSATGFGGSGPPLFTSQTSGWLSGPYALGQIEPSAPTPPLAAWPEANENTLTSVALPPGANASSTATSGALAVGLDGAALHYDAVQGWLPDPVPTNALAINLFGVAFSGPTEAFAVGSFGTILDWNGSTWSEDPQSNSLTTSQLNSIACAANGECWAVGTFGTILHWDGTSWSIEQLDPADAGILDMTSVTIAGTQELAVAGGNLFVRGSGGTWNPIDPSQLPGSYTPGTLRLVSGLPDGGAVAAGENIVLVRQGQSQSFDYSDQPITGTAVALAAFRDPTTSQVGAFVSVAPGTAVSYDSSSYGIPYPSGDGELLVETSSGWRDLSQSQYPANLTSAGITEGVPQPDPVLAVASSPDGGSAWAVGGYAGVSTASGAGNGVFLAGISASQQTSSIWRYDAGGSAQAPTLSQATTSLPAQPSTVSFAFFSTPDCSTGCSTVSDAQPDVNLSAATAEMAAFASQAGGPAFAMLGGDATGRLESSSAANADLANLHNYLAPIGTLPLYAALGPTDGSPAYVDALAQSPGPFGLGAVPAGVTPISNGGTDGSLHKYYSFEQSQNGGTLFVIVLDNASGSLEGSAQGQTAWLQGQLAAADAAGLPIVVFSSLPLDSAIPNAATDADAVATLLANAGVLAVFTTSPTQSDTTHLVPFQEYATGALQIPEYEGASLGYQQTGNDGVLWYFVSVDTATRTVSVQGIPVIQSLALEPLDGLTVPQSSTLSFRGVGARPTGTLGGGIYASIPSPSCGSCVTPSYTFTSSNPAVGDFVVPSGAGSLFPLLGSSGHPTHSATSGLFCAYNPGTTTVSVTSGLLTASVTVTVLPGGVGLPCGTVNDKGNITTTVIPGHSGTTTTVGAAPGASSPPPPAPAQIQPTLPAIKLPPAPPISAAAPKPAPNPPVPPAPGLPPATPFIVAATGLGALAATVVTPIPPPVTPIPPGGATAPSAARREEKVKKHAQQSAFATRPSGVSGTDWFYPVVGIASLLAILLAGLAVGRSQGAGEEIRLELWDPDHSRRRRRF